VVLWVEATVVEQLPERAQSGADALGVVEPVDAEQDHLGLAEPGPDLRRPPAGGPPAGHELELVDVDRDREVPDRHRAAVVADQVVVDLGRVDELVGGGDEVARAAVALEAEHVGAEETLHDLGAPRQALEQLERWERDVVEPADAHVGALRAQHARHELQVVVVDPDRGVLRGDVRQPDREALVHVDVGVPVGAVEARLADRVVVERPQGVVREALVVAVHLLLGDRHRVQVDAVDVDHLGRTAGGTRPADPAALALLHDRQQCPHEPTGAGGPLTVGRPGDRQSVGGDDQGALHAVDATPARGWSTPGPLERLGEVGDQVAGVLDADRQAYEVVGHLER
jgi:hypothetical protein